MKSHTDIATNILKAIGERICDNDRLFCDVCEQISDAMLELEVNCRREVLAERKACIEIAESYHRHDQATALLHPEQTAIERATALEIGRKLRARGINE